MNALTHRSQHCSAHTRLGAPCGRWAILGGTVCPSHGGAAPQTRAKAEERLRALVTPSITAVSNIIDHGDSDAVRLAAARYVLELAGYKPTVQVQSESEVLVRVIHEEQPILVLEQSYKADGNGNGRRADG